MHKHWKYFIFFVCLSTNSYSLDVTVKKTGEDKWNPSEKALIEKAAKITFSRIAKNKIATCAYRNIFRGKTKSQVRDTWSRQIPVLNKSKGVVITVNKTEMNHKRLGTSWVGKAHIDRNKYEILNLELTVNSNRFTKDALKHSQKTGEDKEINRWVQVIAHELGHNLGYHHQNDGTGWQTNYPGYFVTELGYCVMSNGKYGSHLGDIKKWKDWKKEMGTH